VQGVLIELDYHPEYLVRYTDPRLHGIESVFLNQFCIQPLRTILIQNKPIQHIFITGYHPLASFYHAWPMQMLGTTLTPNSSADPRMGGKPC